MNSLKIDIREDEKVSRKNIAISVKFSIKKEVDEEEIFTGEFNILRIIGG